MCIRDSGIVVFNTPGANSEAVKELVICALLLSSRDIVGGIEWVESIADKGDEVAAMVEKGKKAFIGPEPVSYTHLMCIRDSRNCIRR